MEKQEWKVRDGNEKDMEQILSLRKIVFGEMEKDKLDPGFWKWEFIEGPDGRALIYIIEDGGKIVGHFSDIPHRFFVNGKSLQGTISVDLMVHPDDRRRGFFFLMGRYASHRVRSERWDFMASFPIREETIRGFAKLGWKAVVELPVLVYPVRFQGIINRYLRFPPASLILGGITGFLHGIFLRSEKMRFNENMRIDEVKEIDALFDPFWEKAVSSFPIVGIRSRSYLTRRYLEHPRWSYTIHRAMEGGEMKGYVVLRKVDLLEFKSAIIVDLLALDEDALRVLVMRAIEYSRQEGRDLLGFMVPRNHKYYRILRRMGFLPSGKRFLLMVYPHGHERELLDAQDWYVNWGDTDVM